MLGDTGSYQGLRGGNSNENTPSAITDVGCEREINEDRYAVIDCSAGRMWVVCDGMGGVQGGELAAQLAIDAMRRGLESRQFNSSHEAMGAAIEEANRVIVLRRQNPQFSSMGTTIVAALINGDEVVLGNAGDSRAYLVRGNEIQQLTIDHTYVQDLVDRGMISEEDAMHHPQAHVLTKCLGAEPRLEIARQTFWIWDVSEGDVSDKLVLCSDGLYAHVTDEAIAEQVAMLSPQEACIRLVELAKHGGGYDNITVSVIPLGGQLREEVPPSSQTSRRVQQTQPEEEEAPGLSLSKHLLVAFLLSVIGAVLTAMMIFFKISAE